MTTDVFEYALPVDICNRALQKLGIPRMSTLQDNTKEAASMLFSYDKLRRAELRRNTWKFAIRFAALRPIDNDTAEWVPPAWAIGTTYTPGAIVQQDGIYWYNLAASNVGNQPGSANNAWEVYFGPKTQDPWDTSQTTSYYAQELVYDVSFNSYVSLINANEDALTTPGSWLQLTGGTRVTPGIYYPIGSGPLSQSMLRNLYRLPAGFLRIAPQKPKAGQYSYLGAPGGLKATDWEFDDQYIVTSTSDPIPLRFVADVYNVKRFDDMFCEGLACRLAYENCEELTQSTAKQDGIAKAYNVFMREARLVNSIETGTVEPPEDDYIVARQ